MTWLDHALFAFLALLFPIRSSLFGYRRLVAAEPPRVPQVRRSLFHQAIVIQWTLAACVVALWLWRGRAWSLLRLELRWSVPLAIGAVGALALIAALAMVRRRNLASQKALASVRAQLRHVERLFPRTREDLRWFYVVCATAGICEELLYRGYLIWYLDRFMGVIPAAALASAIFGLGHLYQGARGVLTTGLVGAVFSALVLATDSLLPAMVIHGFVDAHSGRLAQAAFEDSREGIGATEAASG